MSTRYVIDGLNGLLNLRAALLPQDTHGLATPLMAHLCWMINPYIGLPRNPFVVWRMPHPGGSPSKQDLANLPGWQMLEIVGLPIDATWSDTSYLLERQGFGGLQTPSDAAATRLALAGPRTGWPPLTVNGGSVPAWQPPLLDAYLKDVQSGRLLRGVHDMLRDNADASLDFNYTIEEQRPGQLSAMLPQLLINQASASLPADTPASAEWQPMRILAVSASSDPFAALALGFGTAIGSDPSVPNAIYMVSVKHRFIAIGLELELELADVVMPHPSAVPDPPSALAAAKISHTRPQVLDGPALESVRVGWARQVVPPDPTALPGNYPASYAVAAFGPGVGRAGLLLTPRPHQVGGWLPYVASRASDASGIGFVDNRPCTTTVAGQTVPAPLGISLVYAVATQDLFGRWSGWQTVAYQGAPEAPQTPSVLSVQLKHTGELTIDFSWDWSDRSPEFIKLVGSFADETAIVFTAVAHFGGNAAPSAGGPNIVALTQTMQPASGFGTPQDKLSGEPGSRYYRLSANIAVNFAGRPWRDFHAQAQGQCHLHQLTIPGFNIGPLSPAVGTRVYDPTPPSPPPFVKATPPEVPLWASLRDVTGTSRALLKWTTAPSAAGYVLYEATETALLSALNRGGPDTSQPFVLRLATLRQADLPSLRSAFRRVRTKLLLELSYEVTLPRGSNVMHFYAITAMSANNVESDWPTANSSFIAVAAPRLAVPEAPALEAVVDPNAVQPTVNVSITVGDGVATGQLELYRVTADEPPPNADAMGPPITTVTPSGRTATFADTGVRADWNRVWYRAVAWSSQNDLQGLVEARSQSSAPVSIVLPAPAAPTVADLRVNLPGSTPTEALISFATTVTPVMTPLGPHRVIIEASRPTGESLTRLDDRLDAMPAVASEALLPPLDPMHRIIRVGTPDAYRLFAWLPRPAANQALDVVAKIIDPLGRIGTTQASVPPLPAFPPPELGEISFLHPAGPAPLRPVFVTWQIVSSVVQQNLAQYKLHVRVGLAGNPPGTDLQATLDTIPTTPALFASPPRSLRRLQNAQTYVVSLGVILASAPLIATVTLTDPSGQTVTRDGHLI